MAEGVSRGRGPRRSRVVKAEVRSKAAGGRCGGRRRRARGQGDRPCRGWRASEVRTGHPGPGPGGEASSPRGPGGGSPKRGARAPRSAACARSLCLLLAGEARFRGAVSRQTRPGSGCCFGFLHPSAAPFPAPASRAPGVPAPSRGRTCPGVFGAQPGGRASVARDPPSRARGGPRRPRGQWPRTQPRAGSSQAVSLLLAG